MTPPETTIVRTLERDRAKAQALAWLAAELQWEHVLDTLRRRYDGVAVPTQAAPAAERGSREAA